MDKFLLTAFLTALAGFITFVVSIVKLVNEKESTTTEYRQSWTNSVRISLAELIAKLNALASNMSYHKKLIAARFELESPEKIGKDEHKRTLDFMEASLTSSASAKRQLRREIYEAYALARLHFKPNDVSFSRIEHKFDVVMPMIDDLEDMHEPEKWLAMKEKIHSEVKDITGYCRDILKTEWETVKRGEPTYQQTKQYSIYGGVLTLFVLMAIGLYAAIGVVRGESFFDASMHGEVALKKVHQPTAASIVEKTTTSSGCPSIEINVSNSNHGASSKQPFSPPPKARPECTPAALN